MIGTESKTERKQAPHWPLLQRLAFRLACVYLILYNLPFPLNHLPGGGLLTHDVASAWQKLVVLFGDHVLSLDMVIVTTRGGSGDTTFHYVQAACIATASVLITLVWSVCDRRRQAYAELHDGLRTYIRYSLAWTMLTYGMMKIAVSQFGFPTLTDLVQTYGGSSPMGLLWNFMGYAAGYQIFTGVAEWVGGLLLFLRRTTSLGALVIAGVMANVVVLNLCYDVPVKLHSTHLLMMALFLLLPDVRRLADVLVFNRPVAAVDHAARLVPPSWHRRRTTLKALFITYALLNTGILGLPARLNLDKPNPHPPLYGIHEVVGVQGNADALPASIPAITHWRYLIVDDDDYSVIKQTDGKVVWVQTAIDAAKGTLTLTRHGSKASATFTFAVTTPGHWQLQRTTATGTLTLWMQRQDETQFELVKRGFHWINEVPYNH